MKHSALFVLVCVFLAFAATAVVSRDIFDRLPHLEDEFAYLYQARIFARGEVYIETPRPYRAYWQPFLINDDGRRFGKYSPGWPLVLAVGARYDQPWIVNAWLAMLTVALVYRLGRELYNPETGAVAALLTAISPGMLLLNGSLMGHTAALFFTTLFFYALWRVEQQRRAVLWGLVGGAALGMVLITRPLTAVGVGAPFVAYHGIRVLWHGITGAWQAGWLRSLLAVSAAGVLVGLLWPAFNYTVSAPRDEGFPSYLGRFLHGDDDTNLYLRVWGYDRVGFGANHGRNANGHTPEAGWRSAKKDLACASRDLFGWAAPTDDGVTVEDNACLTTSRGYSWVLLPLGFLLAIRRRWTWLLAAVPAGLVAVYIAYWIGGRLYSARYYAEGLTAVTLISAVGFTQAVRLLAAGAARLRAFRAGWPLRAQWVRWGAYGALGAAAIYSLVIYTPARLDPLRGYGRISQAQIDEVNRLRREPEKDVVVIVWGEHHWRDVAALMGVTDPFLDSEIVLARDPDMANLDQLRERWADREQLFYVDGTLSHTPPEPSG